jgi:hypothetical protein
MKAARCVLCNSLFSLRRTSVPGLHVKTNHTMADATLALPWLIKPMVCIVLMPDCMFEHAAMIILLSLWPAGQPCHIFKYTHGMALQAWPHRHSACPCCYKQLSHRRASCLAHACSTPNVTYPHNKGHDVVSHRHIGHSRPPTDGLGGRRLNSHTCPPSFWLQAA